MIDPVFQSDNYQLARKLLDASVVRQQAIASNIANVDTPGYRRLDVAPDFATQLRTRLESGKISEAEALQPSIIEDRLPAVSAPMATASRWRPSCSR